MTTLALALVLGSAGLHAVWNFLYKRARDKRAFAWLFGLASVAIYAPVFAIVVSREPVSTAGWLAVLLSAVVHTLYFFTLGSGYSVGDLSLVYPLARGTGPLLVPVWAVLFLGERLSLVGIAGIAAVVAGVYTLHLREISLKGLAAPLRSIGLPSTRIAIVSGVLISAYTVVDKVGVEYFEPFVYMYLWTAVYAVLYAPFVLRTSGWEAVKKEWRLNAVPIVVVGFLIVFTYTMVLFAMTMINVSYVASAREVGVVFGAALGTLLLKEPYGRAKVGGAVLIAVGIVLIALAG